MSEKKDFSIIPQEMREAVKGSFPLSPRYATGHRIIINLYAHFRQEFLAGKSLDKIFDTNNPLPPTVFIPGGHRDVDPIGLTQSLWNQMLEAVFKKTPSINVKREIRDLIKLNADSDREHFEGRLAGGKSEIVPGQRPPSLLRAFVYEGMFPYKNEFFNWVLSLMAEEVMEAAKNNFDDAWASGLKGLVLMWNAHFPNEPFIPGWKEATPQETKIADVDFAVEESSLPALEDNRNPSVISDEEFRRFLRS